MTKLEKVMKDRKVSSLSSLLGGIGDYSKVGGIQRVLDGEADISGLGYSTLQSLARSLGTSINDIMYDFDIDGTSGQIMTIKRVVERFKYSMSKLTVEKMREKEMVVQNGYDQVRFDTVRINEELENLNLDFKSRNKLSLFYDIPSFVWGINIGTLEYGDGAVINPFPYNKKNYDFINPKVSHSEQTFPDSTTLNSEYIKQNENRDKWNKKDLPLCINSLANRKINECPALVIYTKLPSGGDFKIALSVLDKRGNTEFSEVYGCEWLDKANNKSIVYYKSQYFDPIDKNNIRDCEKTIISEIEFFKGIMSQHRKFGVSK